MASPDTLELDTSRWPLVVVHLPSTPVSDDAIERFIEAQRAMLKRRERYIEITDTQGVHMFPPSQRKRMAEFLRETNALGDQLCAGLGIVIPSAVLRGGMTAIFWIFKPSYPIKAASTHQEAAAFLLEAAAKAGLDLPPSARDYLMGNERRQTA